MKHSCESSPVTWNRKLRRDELYSSGWEIFWVLIGTGMFALMCLAMANI